VVVIIHHQWFAKFMLWVESWAKLFAKWLIGLPSKRKNTLVPTFIIYWSEHPLPWREKNRAMRKRPTRHKRQNQRKIFVDHDGLLLQKAHGPPRPRSLIFIGMPMPRRYFPCPQLWLAENSCNVCLPQVGRLCGSRIQPSVEINSRNGTRTREQS
jgi:hypothetical protein